MRAPMRESARTVAWALCLPQLLGGCGDRRPPTADAPTPAERVRAALPSFQATTPPADSAEPRVAQVRKLLQAQRWEEARSALEVLVPADPSNEAAFLLGWLHHERERYPLALPWLARALEGGPTYPKARQVFFLYGRCLQETGELAGARAAYEADQLLFPDGGDGLFRLALLDFEEGRLEDSERRLGGALERFERPRDRAKVHAHLADVHLTRGELDAARSALELCVALFPHYEAFYKLSRLCTRLGDDAAAARFLDLHRQWRARARPEVGRR